MHAYSFWDVHFNNNSASVGIIIIIIIVPSERTTIHDHFHSFPTSRN